MSDNKQGSTLGPFLLGAVTGGVVGAAVALLLAPSSGEHVRKSLGERLDDLADNVAGVMQKATGAANEVASDSFDEGERIIRAARSRVEELIDEADRTIDSARKAAREVAMGSAATNERTREESEIETNGVLDRSDN